MPLTFTRAFKDNYKSYLQFLYKISYNLKLTQPSLALSLNDLIRNSEPFQRITYIAWKTFAVCINHQMKTKYEQWYTSVAFVVYTSVILLFPRKKFYGSIK